MSSKGAPVRRFPDSEYPAVHCSRPLELAGQSAFCVPATRP